VDDLGVGTYLQASRMTLDGLAPVVVMEREMVLTCLIEVAAERPCLDP
jgi:hypothetical protein